MISESLDEILKAPTPHLFIVAGLGFLGIAVVGDISGKINPGKIGRIAAGVIGAVLLAYGLFTHPSEPASGSSAQMQGPKQASPSPKERLDATPSLVFDFLAEAPRAIWTSNSGSNH